VWLNKGVQKLACTFVVLKQVDLTLSITMKEEYMQKQNLFVGSLAYATTDDSLKAFFEQIGEVERAMVAKERETGRSRGFGFVTFVDEANNQKAVDLLNGKELDGRAITVTVARPREDKPRRDFGGGNNHGGGNGGGNSFRQRSW
jgi:RNA recognition motif-containing protein